MEPLIDTAVAQDRNRTNATEICFNGLSRLPFSVSLTVVFLLAWCFCLAVAGNALSIAVLFKAPGKKSANSVFTTALCCVDLLQCLTGLPFEISRFARGQWIHGSGALCVVRSFLSFIGGQVSVLLIVLITADRYVRIVFFEHYSRLYTTRMVYGQVVGVFLYAFLALLPTLLGVWGQFGVNCSAQDCTILPLNGRSPKSFHFIFIFMTSIAFICICYSHISVVVLRSKRRVCRFVSAPDAVDGRHCGSCPRLNDLTVFKVGVIVFLDFVVCYLPYLVSVLIDPDVRIPQLYAFGHVAGFCSMWTRPVIYVSMIPEYREAFKALCWTLFVSCFDRNKVSMKPLAHRVESVMSGGEGSYRKDHSHVELPGNDALT